MAPYKKFNKVTVSTKKIELPKKVKIGSEPKAAFNWFPGHMYRALRIMTEFKRNVDVFLEIRDARAPISSKNDEFDALI